MTTSSGIEISGQGRAVHRLALVALGSLVVGVLSSLITLRMEPSAFSSAWMSAGLTWFLCVAMACWLVWKVGREPDAVLRAWLGMAIVHFGIVAGGSVALIMLAGFHPASTLLSSCATCFVFVYGGAWMVSAIRTEHPGGLREKDDAR